MVTKSWLRILFGLFALVLLAITAQAQNQKKGSAAKNQYTAIEIAKFDVKEGVNFPADYMTGLMDETVKELKDIKKFQTVYREGEPHSEIAAPTIRLIGTVTKYQAGSRAKRYFIGFGAGKTKVVVHVKFIDSATGNVAFEKDVDGKVIIGIFGGESKGSLHGVGKEIAEVAKKQFF